MTIVKPLRKLIVKLLNFWLWKVNTNNALPKRLYVTSAVEVTPVAIAFFVIIKRQVIDILFGNITVCPHYLFHVAAKLFALRNNPPRLLYLLNIVYVEWHYF